MEKQNSRTVENTLSMVLCESMPWGSLCSEGSGVTKPPVLSSPYYSLCVQGLGPGSALEMQEGKYPVPVSRISQPAGDTQVDR